MRNLKILALVISFTLVACSAIWMFRLVGFASCVYLYDGGAECLQWWM